MKRILPGLLAFGLCHFPAAAEEAAPPAVSPHRPQPFGATLSFDGTARLGFDGRLLWTFAPTRMGASAAHEPDRSLPLAIDVRAGALQWKSGGRAALATSGLASLALDRGRVWIGLAAHEPARLFDDARVHAGAGVVRRAGDLEIGAGMYARRAHVPGAFYPTRVRVPGFSDSTLPGPTLRHPARDPIWTTSQVTMTWQRGPGSISVAGGVTLGPLTLPRRWAHVAAQVQVTRSMAMTLAVGQRAPAAVAFDPRVPPGTSVAFTYAPLDRPAASVVPPASPAPRDWRVARLDGARFALHVRCARAKSIEVRGDFTEWDALEMRDVGSAWWECTGEHEPGLVRLQIRIDGGEWTAPAGLPQAADGDRRVGTIVIE